MSDKDPDMRRNAPSLALQVPEPHARPGDAPDFSWLQVPSAGSTPRPDVAAPAGETYALADTLLRVLDEEHRAVGPWDPKLDPETLRKMLRDMVVVRTYDDRMYRAQRQGKIGFYGRGTGGEAIALPAAQAG